MKTYSLPPIPALRSYVKNIWVVENTGGLSVERMIPFGCVDLVYVEREYVTYQRQERSTFVQNELFLTGQVTAPYDFHYAAGAVLIGIGFYPHTAHLFTRIPSNELTDGVFPLHDLLTRHNWPEVEACTTMMDKIVALQTFVSRQIEGNATHNQRTAYVQYLLQELFSKKGPEAFSQARQELGISQRYAQLLFREYVGVSPGLYAKIIRFLEATMQPPKNGDSLSHFALDLGYYDQSHFIRDFKRFSGFTPRQYFRQPEKLIDQFTSNPTSSLLYNSIPAK